VTAFDIKKINERFNYNIIFIFQNRSPLSCFPKFDLENTIDFIILWCIVLKASKLSKFQESMSPTNMLENIFFIKSLIHWWIVKYVS